MASPLDDQLQAAEAELVALAEPIRARADVHGLEVTADQAAELAALLDRAADPCPHLSAVPLQPAFVIIGVGFVVADCLTCWTARRGEIRQCTVCRQDVPEVAPVVYEAGHRLAVLPVCLTCRADVLTLLGQHDGT